MDQHQQTSRHPKSSLTSETSHWTSSNMDSVPLHSSSRPWFPNEKQNLLSSEKGTLDHWATVQFFFSLAQVRCFWRCLWFRSGLVALSWRSLSVVNSWCTWLQLQFTPCEALPSVWNRLCWLYSQACSHPCCLCTFSYPFLPSSQLCINMLDTALCKQPHLSVMTFCDLPSLWRASVFVFWIIAKSAVFPIIVVSKNMRHP